MSKNYPLAELQAKISDSQRISIVLPLNPSFDKVASGLSLYLSLLQAGKSVSIICPSPMTVEFNRLVAVDKIVTKAKGSNLVVSFNYPVDQIEKVSYNDDSGKPNVVIQPKAGATPLSEDLVLFSYEGMGEDLLITIGLTNLQDLSSFDQSKISPDKIININNKGSNLDFCRINIIDEVASSVSEMVFIITNGLQLPFGIDEAQNILSGIWKETRSLSDQRVGADTYETVAACLRLGAQKPQEFMMQKKVEDFSQKPKFIQRQPQFVKPIENKNKPTPPVEEKPKEIPVKPPADWFEPKIFKGSSIS